MSSTGRESSEPLDATLDNVASDSFSHDEADRPKVEIVAGLRPQLSGEIQALLRSRLRLAAVIILVPSVVFTARGFLGWEPDKLPPFVGAYRILMVAILAACSLALWTRWTFSLLELRAIELAVFGLPCILFLFVHYFQMQEAASPLAAGLGGMPVVDVQRVRLASILTQFMWFGMVLIYGTFIPNSLRRAALIMGAMSLVPILVIGLSGLLHASLRSTMFPSELSQSITTMILGYVTALYGSYKLSSLRREAFEARQLGQYRLTECIGSGGMGEVYLAEHQLLKRPCAIKLIRPSQAADAKALARFEREVRAIARLTHWNSVEIFDYGRADDGTFYYAMEYLPGLSLQEIVERQGPIQPERAVHLLRQVCQALSEAHRMGILHRDIKPSNIVASQRGGIYDVSKLLDFGLATSAEETQEEIKLTQEGTIAGSPLYMAPERVLEEDEGDPRSDIYSLGAVAYFVLTGQPPFRGNSPLKVMIAHAREPVVNPRQLCATIPPDLEDVILCCLSKDPSGRYPDALSLERALAACACADHWTQEMAVRWWTSRPQEQSLDTQTAAPAATLS